MADFSIFAKLDPMETMSDIVRSVFIFFRVASMIADILVGLVMIPADRALVLIALIICCCLRDLSISLVE